MEQEREIRRHRSRSLSEDSEEERRRRRRRREREERDMVEDRGSAGRERDPKKYERSDRTDARDRYRRRSRSPTSDLSGNRHHGASSKYKTRGGRSPQRQRSRERRSTGLKDDGNTKVATKRSGPLPSQAESFSMTKDPSTALVRAEDQPVQEKQKPNFNPTGLLAAASNTIANLDGTSIVLKYHEPPEARKPPTKDSWKLFIFKGSDIIETIELGLRSCWLIGRELAIVDLPAEHPSISKQHAVIQFRYIEKRNEFGDKIGRVRPYLIDLESANGTILNRETVPSSRYIELRDKDMIQFGDSTREYAHRPNATRWGSYEFQGVAEGACIHVWDRKVAYSAALGSARQNITGRYGNYLRTAQTTRKRLVRQLRY